MDIYAENIIDHWKRPHRKRLLAGATVEHNEENVACGDSLRVSLIMRNGMVKDVGWTGDGCAISQAGMSILSEELIGETEEEISALTKENVHALLGVPVGPRRFKCALLCLHTVKNALRKAKGLAPQSWVETVAVDEE